MTRLLRIGFALILLATVGLVGGLVYGWFLSPVVYRDVDPADLAQTYKQDYVRLVAASYLLTHDVAFARERLAALGYDADDLERETRAAIQARDRWAPALAALSHDLGIQRPEFIAWLPTPTPTSTPTPTPTPTSTPTPTPTPVPTATPTSTATPSATPTPPPTPTPVPTATRRPASPTPRPPLPTSPPAQPTATSVSPTATPQPAPTVDFVVTKTRMLSIQENAGCEGMNVLFVRVVDAAGNPLDGIIVRIRWDGGQEEIVSGSKAPGRAEFALYGAYWAQVVRDVGGRTYTSQETRRIDSVYPDYADLIQGGYCKDEADCRDKDAKHQLCYGHYSWEVEFQRTW